MADKKNRRVSTTFVRHFAPEHWNYARKFQAFLGPPFTVDTELATGTSAVVSHREKYELLGGIANKLADELELDGKDLEERGYTDGARGRSFAAIAEEMAGELYAMLDGLRRTTYSIYRGQQGMQNKKTSVFFERAAQNRYDNNFPTTLNTALADAYQTWFPQLRRLRTQTTHGETGTCWYNAETETISYWHPASHHLKDLSIENVVAYINQTYGQVSTLAELFFKYFYLALLPVESRHGCGVYKGRFYERMVAPTADVSFSTGRCWSRAWFETEAGYDCPLREKCGAYEQPVPAKERDAYFARLQPST
jgi:hypothetical protein